MRLTWVVLLFVVATTAFGEAFVIDNFDVVATLGSNGNVSVQETISVTFTEDRRGIFRVIPTEYETGRRTTRRILITDVSVSDQNGRALETKLTREGPNLKIRIGSKNITLPAGTSITYVIRYDAFGVVNWFRDSADWEPYAELYWNATGNEWPTEIRQASVRVKFPTVAGGKGLRARVFAGTYGAKDSESLVGLTEKVYGEAIATNCELTESELICVRAEPLGPFQGLTFVLDLPAKLIAEPTFWQKTQLLVLPNLGFGIPIIVFALLGLLWTRAGRDPKGGAMAVQFEPPDGMTGSEAGTMLDETVDQRDVAAGIVTLAVAGYLKMHVGEEGSVFSRRSVTLELIPNDPQKPKRPIEKFEKRLLDLLEQCPGDMISDTDLRSHVAPHIAGLKSSLYDELVERGLYRSSPENVRIGWLIGSIVVTAILAFFITVLSPFKDPMPAIIGGVISLPIIFLITRQMPKRTPLGARTLQKVRGFEEFIRRARGDELRSMLKREPDLSLFEEYLPHAVAFGLTKQWAKAFDGILTEMPQWYASPYGGYNYMYFGPDLDTTTNSLGSAAMTPPRSSGAGGGNSGWSGGGGFSGGGFGGGGGGSW